MKWTGPVFHLSLDGITTETLILSIGLAVVLGVFPVYGCPTLLCVAAAAILRLSLPAMQLVNVLTSPLQLALLIPFHRLGDWLLPGPGAPVSRVSVGTRPVLWRLIGGIWTLAVHAIAGWFCVCLPLGILLYLVLRWAARTADVEQSLLVPASLCTKSYNARRGNLVRCLHRPINAADAERYRSVRRSALVQGRDCL